MSVPDRWSRPADVVMAVRRRWEDGTLLRAGALGEAFPVVDVPLSGPTARDLGGHLEAARTWALELEQAARGGIRFTLEFRQIGGRDMGRTKLPGRAKISSFDQAWRILGVAHKAREYNDLIQRAKGMPDARLWALDHPHSALAVADDWVAILAAVSRLDQVRGSGVYLRQISAPGVHTKLIEQRRSVIASIIGVSSNASGFVKALGLLRKPPFVRLRFGDGQFGFPSGITEAQLRTTELSGLDLAPTVALIVENEVTYLSVPVPVGGIVLWGKGYDANEPASLAWLKSVPVGYWGDIDTHGFAILNRVRSHLPQTTSFLMDRDTLLKHEERWSRETTPTTAALDELDRSDAELYANLVTDSFGTSVRLEQELIDWDWAIARLPTVD